MAWHTRLLTVQQARAKDASIKHCPRFLCPGATHHCDAGSLHRLPETTGAHILGRIPGGLHFPSGGHFLPHADHLYLCPPWGLSVPVPFRLSLLLVLFHLRLLPALSGLVVLLCVCGPSAGGSSALPPCFPPLPSSSATADSSPPSSDPPPWPLGCVGSVMMLPGFGH